MVQPFHLSDHSHLSHNNPSMINRRRRTITRAPTLHPEDAQEPYHMKSILCVRPRSRLHSCLLGTLQAPQEAHSPHSFAGKEIPLHPHKGLFTEHLAQISVLTNSNILSASTQLTVFVSPSGSTIRWHHHNTPSNLHQVPALLDNWKSSMSKKVGIETFY